jgi:hypothetical protein
MTTATSLGLAAGDAGVAPGAQASCYIRGQ